MGLDPIHATNHLRESYLRYLATAFPLKDTPLAEQFRALLSEPERLLKGPYLEATPPFRTGASISDLIRGGVLSHHFERLDGAHLPVSRPRYVHQVDAIRNLVAGRNVAIATGTGSGKTEAFLIPILNHLFRELESGTLGPGVRALLLYPMNALANDQLKRLRRLLTRTPEIRFGRYTGETETSHRAAEEQFHRNYPREPKLPNELLAREDMQQGPPHILLTNYAMLEYLLLRPDDSTFFDGTHAKHWRFIVLDEAHTYNGAVGIELAMLLRRLADRVVQSERGRLRCVATSATLGGGPGDFEAVARFATRLFSEQFETTDVVEATRIPLSALGESWGRPNPTLYRRLLEAIDADSDAATLTRMAEDHGVPAAGIAATNSSLNSSVRATRTQRFLYEILKGDGHLIDLRRELESGPIPIERAAEQVFGPGHVDDLVPLVALAARARAGVEDLPLLPARYHVFVRALEGAYVALGQPPQLYLDRMHRTPDGTGVAFEAATCKRCGQLYLVGTTVDDQLPRLMPPATLREEGGSDVEFYRVLSSQEPFEVPDDEDEAVAASEDESTERTRERFSLCASCGAIRRVGELGELCSCGPEQQRWAVERVKAVDRQVNHCRACGTRSPGVVLRFLTGQDAPASVLATALYQAIPAAPRELERRDREQEDDWNSASREPVRTGDGRKLLIFSDSRQDAAFFACYLDRTYSQILRRRLIAELLSRRPDIVRDRWRIEDLVDPLVRLAEEKQLFSSRASRRARRNEAWKWVMQELVATDRRHGLEGVGLVAFELARPLAWQPPRPLMQSPWGLSSDETWTLYQVLLDTLRLQQAITFPDGVNVKDEEFSPRNRDLYFRQQGSSPKRGVFSWGPARLGCRNRRLDFLAKLYRRCAGTDATEEVVVRLLSDIWSRSLTAAGSAFREYLEESRIKDEGVVYRLRHECFELAGFDESGWFRCDRCGNLTRCSLRGVCPTYLCDGQVQPCDPNAALADDHYRRLYLDAAVVPMRVEEHTAQLTADAAAKLQEQFIQNEVNVLSCSTTFELGVDVGELEAVFLRNVPPETANYVQRAGRAGRRTEATAFVVTFCQRRSHDLSHYREPERMIAGRIEPPYFELRNEKIVRRHVQAVALARFLTRAT